MRMDAFLSATYPWLALILGLLIGSFLNVVIYRLPAMMLREQDEGESSTTFNLWWPPSHCPSCQHNIMPWDNIPVLSWLWLRGKCRYCHCHISFIYPLSEALIGAGYMALVLWYYPHYSIIQLAFLALFFSVLYTLAVIDFKTYLLPDSLVFLLLWVGLIACVRNLIPLSPRDCVMGAVIIWAFSWSMAKIFAWVTGREGFGQGDVKLFAACGVWVGADNIAALMLGSAGLGALFFIVQAVKRRFAKQQPDADEFAAQGYIPFGPAICITAAVLMCTEVLSHG